MTDQATLEVMRANKDKLLAAAQASGQTKFNVNVADYAQPAPADSVDTSVNIPPANPPDPQVQLDTQVGDKSLVERSFRRAGQDILATPAMAALPRIGIAGLQYMTGINQTFEEGVMTPEAQEVYKIATSGDDPQRSARAAAVFEQMTDEQKIRPVMRWAKDWYDWGGEIAGTMDNPDGTVPLDEEVGGTLLTAATAIPTGGLGVLAKGLGFSGKLSAKLASNTALKVAGQALEVATPITIGATKSNIAANAAVGLALNDVVRHAMDEDTLTESILGFDDDLPGEETSTLGEKAQVGGVAVGAAALSLAMGRGGGRIAKNIDDFVPEMGDDAAQLGEIPMQNMGDVLKTAENKVLDESAVIKQAAEVTIGKKAAEKIDDVVRATTGNTVDAQTDRAYRMGALSQDGTVKFHKPLNAVREQFTAMGQNKQNLFDKTYAALNQKANIKRFGKKVDTNEIDNIISMGMADPEIRRLADDMNKVMQKFSEWRWREGVISKRQYQKEVTRGYYMPQTAKKEELGKIRATAEKVGNLFSVRNNKADSIDVSAREKRRTNMEGDFEPISKSFDDYAQSQMREVNANTARRELLESIDGQKVVNHKGDTDRILVRKLEQNEASSGRTVRVMRDGKEHRYDVGDKRLMRALQFRPRSALPIANKMRKFYQSTTTGAFNPLFKPMSAVYDMTFAALGTRTHRVTGPLDAALKQMGAPDSVRATLAGPVRVVDIPYTYMQGVFSGIYGRRLEMQAVHAAELAAKTGNPLDQAAATKVADKFLQSMYGTMHRYGRTGGMLTDVAVDHDNARALMKKKIQDTSTLRWYNHVLDTVGDGMQMGLFTRNYAQTVNDVHADAVRLAVKQGITPPAGKATKLSKAEIMRLANDVRNVAADPTKQAASDTVNVFASGIPYGNIILQSTGHLAHHMLTNRAAQSTVAFMGAVKVAMVMTMSAEQREHYEQTMPAWQRVGYLPMHFGDTVDDMVMVPIGPELGTVSSVAAEAMQGMIESDNELKIMSTPERLLASFTDLIGFAAPPALTVPIAAASGQQPRMGDALRGEGFLKDPNEYAGIPEQRGIGMNEGWVGDRLAAIVYSATGVAGRMVIDSAEALLDHPAGALSKEAWAAAMDTVLYNQAKQPVAQGIGLLFGNQVTKPDARVTPLSDKAYAVDRALKQADNVFRGLDPDYEQELDVDIPFSGLQQLPKVLKDPALQQQAELVNEYFYAPEHAVIMKEIGQLHEGYRRTRNNPNNKIKDVNTVLRKINDATNDRYKELLANYSSFEDYMSEQTGKAWTLNSFMNAAVKDVYSE